MNNIEKEKNNITNKKPAQGWSASGRKKVLSGIVVSDKMKDTAVVAVERFVKHQKYGKFIKRVKKYKAHNKDNTHKVGDKVSIETTKPISKDKAFIIIGN